MYNNIFDLIPKDKYDNSNIKILKTIAIEDAEPILNNLLEWLQDLNWPVARDLVEVLPRFHLNLIPYIRKVLNSDDDIWKCWVLYLIQRFPIETVNLLSTEIKRIATYPTYGEFGEGTNEYALDAIRMFNL